VLGCFGVLIVPTRGTNTIGFIDADDLAQVRGILTHGGFLPGPVGYFASNDQPTAVEMVNVNDSGQHTLSFYFSSFWRQHPM
jgi:hypothetical protein